MIKIIIKYSICLVYILLLTSCWDQKELTDLSIVAAIGIDFSKENNRYTVTYEIINPKNVVGGEQRQGLPGSPVTILKGEGETLIETSEDSSRFISRQLYFDHADLVVIGEDVARKGLTSVLDILERSPDFRTTAQVIIARGCKAEDLLAILPQVDQVPDTKIVKTLKITERFLGESTQVNIGDLIGTIYFPGIDSIVSGFSIKGDIEKGKSDANQKPSVPHARVYANGMAIFKGEKLVDWAEGDVAKGINFILGNIKNTRINLDWGDQKEVIGVRLERSNAKISSKVVNGKPAIKVSIKTEGHIAEVGVPIKLQSEKEIFKINKVLSKEIKEEIEKSIAFAKDHQSDIFGFGEKFRITQPKYWISAEKNWHDTIFPELDVEVEVESFIRGSDIKLQPFFIDLKKKGAE